MLFTSIGGTVAQPSFRRRRLAKKLQEQRESAGLTVAEAVRLSGFSQAKLSRIETGAYGVSGDDVHTLCEAYGADEETTESFTRLARQAKERNLWWRSYSDILGNANYIELEADSAALHAFTIDIIPGLLQTSGYYEAIIRADTPLVSKETVARRVEARLARQQQIKDQNVRVWAIIDEPALLRPVGGHAVMADQIDYLLKIADTPHVSFQVLPLTAGAHQSIGKPFTQFFLRDGFRVVGIDSHDGGLFMEDNQRVRHFEEAWTSLAAMALPFPHSIEVLRARSEEHRRNAHALRKPAKMAEK